VARSVIQEKTSRIFEVMLAIAKPEDMLAGKLIGVAAVGMTQIAIWLVTGAAIFATPIAAAAMTGNLKIQFSWTEGILFPVYFLLGYLLYSSLFAGWRRRARRSRNCRCICAGCCAHVAEFRDDSADHERFELGVGGGGVVVSADCADCDVSADGLADAAAVAVCVVDRADDCEHLGVLWFSSRLYRVGF